MEKVRQCVGVAVKQSHGVGRTVHQAFTEFPDDIKGEGVGGGGAFPVVAVSGPLQGYMAEEVGH